jgi:hypothetical protein
LGKTEPRVNKTRYGKCGSFRYHNVHRSAFEKKMNGGTTMAAERINPREANEHLRSGAMLVCAYDNDEKFQKNHLQGAISLADFRAQEGSISRSREIIFY